MRKTIVALLIVSILLSFSFIGGCLSPDDKDAEDDKDDDPDDDGIITLPETTKQLSEGLLGSISSLSEDGDEIVFEGSDLSQIEEGDILSVGVSEQTPYGLLRKVQDIESSGDSTTLVTEQATIEDAVEEGRLDFNQTLSEPVKTIDPLPGVSLNSEKTRSDYGGIQFQDVLLYEGSGGERIILNGHLDLEFDLIFILELESFRIQECTFGAVTTFDGELSITSDSDLEFEVEIEVARFEFAPVIMPMGAIEVVIVPVLSMVIGSMGTVTSGLSISAEQNTILDISVKHPDWEPNKDFTSNFEYTTPVLSESISVTCYAGPEMSLLLYGVAGPYITAHGYVKGESDDAGTWWLYGGLSFGLGFKVEILGNTISEWEDDDMIDFRRLIASSMDDLAGGWVVEKLDWTVQLTKPKLLEGPGGDIALVYKSIDPETGYYPIKLAMLKNGVWSFEELVFSNEWDMMDIALDGQGRLYLVYYDGGIGQSINFLIWDGSSSTTYEFSDVDMPGRYVSDLRLLLDENGDPNIYYLLTKTGSGSGFFEYEETVLKHAVLVDGIVLNDTLLEGEDLSITGLDTIKGEDGSIHLTYFRINIDSNGQILVHSQLNEGTWNNDTIFREEALFNNPSRTSIDLDENGDPSILYDDNNGSLHLERYKNGVWSGSERPGVKDPDQGLFSLHLVDGDTPSCSFIDSSSSVHTLYFSMLSDEGWDRVEVFSSEGWRFPGGTDIEGSGGSTMIAFNDGLYMRIAHKSL